MPKHKNYTEILKQCVKIGDERQEQYAPPHISMVEASQILDVVFGLKLSAKEIALVLVALKLSREKNNHKEDNILDTINYLAIYLNL